MHRTKHLSLKHIKEHGEARQGKTMTKVVTGLEIDLAVVIEECHLEIEVEEDSYKIIDRITERIIEGDCKIVIEMTLGEEIIGRCKIIEVRIMEVDIETIIGMTIEIIILEEVEVSLDKDNTQIILEGLTEAAVDSHLGQDQDQGLVQESV